MARRLILLLALRVIQTCCLELLDDTRGDLSHDFRWHIGRSTGLCEGRCDNIVYAFMIRVLRSQQLLIGLGGGVG